MDYREIVVLPSKSQLEELDKLEFNDLIGLFNQAQKYYLHYSEQTDKYCSSVKEKYVMGENNEPLYPKVDKSQIIGEEQFQSLLSKMKRCENLVSLIYSCLQFKLATDETVATEENKEEVEDIAKMTTIIS